MTPKAKLNIEEVTQIALIQLTIQQMKEQLGGMAADIKEIRNTKYVTQNEMQMAITQAYDSLAKDMGSIKNILWLIFSSFAVIIIGSIGRMILKI